MREVKTERSLKEMTIGELGERSAAGDGKLKDIGAEILARNLNIELLLPFLGDKLERQALGRYKENAPWALRASLQDNKAEDFDQAWGGIRAKFRQELTQELSPEQLKEFPVEELLDGLPGLIEDYVIAAVRTWQQDTFDPLANYLKRHEVEGNSKNTLKHMRSVIARFIAKCGRKRRYEDHEILDFLHGEKKRLRSEWSFLTRYREIKSFLKSLPDGGQEIHEREPKKPKDLPNAPTLTKEEIETLICSAFVDKEPLDILARLLLSTVYACRVGEIADFSNEDVDFERGTITILTEKGGERKPQTLPDGLEIFFSNGLKPIPKHKLWPCLSRLLRNAGIERTKGQRGSSQNKSYHAIRRGVVTALYEAEVDGMSIYDWLRWSKKREFGMLPTYVKRKPEKSDLRVLARHPFVPLWQRLVPIIEGGYLHYNDIKKASKAQSDCAIIIGPGEGPQWRRSRARWRRHWRRQRGWAGPQRRTWCVGSTSPKGRSWPPAISRRA